MKILAATITALTLGWGAAGLAIIAASAATIPSAPENLTARERKGPKIRLDWVDTSENEDGFELQRQHGTGPWMLRGRFGPDDNRFLDTSPHLPACYRIRAFNADGQSEFTEPACILTGGPGIPSAPTDLTAREGDDGKFRIRWVDTSDNELGFELQRRPSLADTWSSLYFGANTQRFADDFDLTPHPCYRVRAHNGEGKSDFAGRACIGTEVPPDTCVATRARGASFPGHYGASSGGAADPAIAAGPDRLVLISNAEVSIHCKTGKAVASIGMPTFFAGLMAKGEGSAGDVAAFFDPHSQRFFLSEAAKIHPQTCQPGSCVGHTMLAVSKTSTPGTLTAADWHFYAIDRYLDWIGGEAIPTTNWADFEKLATDERYLVITSRQYAESDGRGLGPKIKVLKKAQLIRGKAPKRWADILSTQDMAGVMPAKAFGVAPTFFLVSRGRGSCGVTVWGVDTKRARNKKPVTRSVPLTGNCATPVTGPQRSGAPVDIAGTGFGTLPVYRDGSLWIADTWRRFFPSGPVAVIKWAELDVSGWPEVRVVQQGEVGTEGVWSFEPSIAVDRDGNLTIAFYTTGPSIYPSISVTRHLNSNPPGFTKSPEVIKAGTGPTTHILNGRNRFADFSSVALDPDGTTVWAHLQYAVKGDWRSWVASVSAIGSKRAPAAPSGERR